MWGQVNGDLTDVLSCSVTLFSDPLYIGLQEGTTGREGGRKRERELEGSKTL